MLDKALTDVKRMVDTSILERRLHDVMFDDDTDTDEDDDRDWMS